MNNYSLFINKFAENDLTISISFYEEISNELKKDFLFELKNIFLRIKDNPYQFPIIKKKARKANLSKFPFAVFFIVDNNVINVFSIFHFSRNPKVWKKRL